MNITISSTVNDDVTCYTMPKIFSTNLQYSIASLALNL